MAGWLQDLLEDMKEWCAGRLWWPRALLLFYCFHLLICHLQNPVYCDPFKGLNLGVHEMGHMVFSFAGEFLTVAGGSLFQCLVPLLSTIMFFYQRDYFAIVFCFAWLSTNLFDVAVYAADARKLELQLVTPFKGSEEVTHDWNYLLDQMDLLHYDYLIAGWLRTAAIVSMLVFLVAGSWLIWQMMTVKKRR